MDNSDPIIANGHSLPNGNSLMMGSSEPIIANGNYPEPIIANGNSSEPIIANGNSVPQLASSSSSSSAAVLAQNRPRILLAACGCVAASQFVDLCREFSEWAEVKAVITKSSREFIDLPSLARDINTYCDEHELRSWRLVDNYVLHIALASWAEVLVIAPLSSHTLAKIAGGLCDNLLTNIVRPWDYWRKPLFVAPSMNKFMWTNPTTEKQCISIDELGITIIQPRIIDEEHDCAMAEPHLINELVRLGYDFN